MSTFDRALEFALRWETGGRGDGAPHTDPHDPGGATRWGIAQTFHPELDVLSLTRDDAVDLYWREYWIPARCSHMPEIVAIAHFDHAVNRGVARANESLQTVVGADADGVLGPKSMAALDLAVVQKGQLRLAVLLICARMRLHLVGAKDVHVRGLLTRCVALQELVLGG